MLSDTFMGWVVFILCSVGGLVMIVGSLVLLGKRIIVLDSEGKQATNVELPFGFKLNTHVPVLVMLLFGVFLFALPIYRSPAICENAKLHKKVYPEMITLKGKTGSPDKLFVRAVVAEQMVDPDGDAILEVPLNKTKPYWVVYTNLAGDRIFDTEQLKWDRLQADNTYVLRGIGISHREAEAQATPTPIQQQLLPARIENEFKDQ